MKKKQFECFLSQLDTFESPKITLEQYSTNVELAEAILSTINENDQIDNCMIADLGCGCGILLLGAAKLGASYCMGIEIDADAIEICRENIEKAGVDCPIDLVQADVTKLTGMVGEKFDTIIMNPPFGTKNNTGVDLTFVKCGLELLKPSGSLFSLHKSATRRHIDSVAKQCKNVSEAKCIAELRWNLSATYAHHRHRTVDIAVDLWQLVKSR